MKTRPRIRVFGFMVDILYVLIAGGIIGIVLLGYLVNNHPGILVLLLIVLFARIWHVKNRV